MPEGMPIHLKIKLRNHEEDIVSYILFDHPVLFSNFVNASRVDTLLSPETTSKLIMAAIVVPTSEECEN